MIVDYKNPDYGSIIQGRLAALDDIRAHPEDLPALKEFYRRNPSDFISDWGVTYDPRNAERGLPAVIPFILFPKQREWVDWLIGHWRSQTPGMTEKSRDMGMTWLAASTACTLCIFYDGIAFGFGSRVVDLVDKIGTMKPILPKARMFMDNLPEEFRAGWLSWRDAPYMRINFPETGSIIMGEGGDQIGRGDRASVYVVDESCYLERAELVEQSLSQTTNCRIDISSVRANTVFARKRHEGKVDVFVFDWRDDPRKDQAWYDLLDKPASEGGKGLDPVTIAQEVDRDYSASVEGIVIPAAWVRSAVDARARLGLKITGRRALSLDVADEGVDKNAACGTTGIEVDFLEEWAGKSSDLFATTQRTFAICDERGYDGFRYDADGLGAGVRGDSRVINEARRSQGIRQLAVEPFRGSEKPFNPEGIVEGTIGSAPGEKGRTNKDYFANRKAQSWWSIARRFYRTFRWVTQGIACDPDEIISLSSKMPLCHKLVTELSQPTRTFNTLGKMLVDKKPDGLKSPNLADAAMIRFAQVEARALNITDDVLAQLRAAGARRRT